MSNRKTICIDSVITKLEKTLNNEDISRAAIIALAEEFDRAIGTVEMGANPDIFADVANKIIRAKAKDNILAARQRILTKVKTEDFFKFANNYIESRPDGTVAEALRAWLVGGHRQVTGSRSSVAVKQVAYERFFLGGFINDLEKIEMFDDFIKKPVDKNGIPLSKKSFHQDLAREMWDLSMEKSTEGGITGNRRALEIAKVIKKWQHTAVKLLNRNGAYIDELQGYIVRQSHDMNKIARASKKDWVEFIKPLLDEEKTFVDIADAEVDNWLGNVYDALRTGIHLQYGADGDVKGIAGSKNLAKSISGNRKLFFKDSDNWFKYNEMFGSGDVTDAVINGLRKASHEIGLMEMMGPTPHTTFENIIAKMKEKIVQGDNKLQKDLSGWYGNTERRLRDFLAEVDGSVNIPAGKSIAKIGQTLRNIQNLKLGSAVVSSITDVPLIMSELHYQGIDLDKAIVKGMFSSFEGMSTGDKKAVSRIAGAGIDGMIGKITTRFGADQDLHGTSSKVMDIWFKLNLLQPWTDINKRGVSIIMAANLGENSKVAAKELNPKLKGVLKMYNITDEKWDIIRKHAMESDGNKYITPGTVMDIPDEAIAKILPNERMNVTHYKEQMAMDLQTYFSDRSDYAVLTPGAEERAMVNMGLQPGTPAGEAMRFIGQFKYFPLALTNKVIRREFAGKSLAGTGILDTMRKAPASSYAGLTSVMAGMTLLGYASMSLKDMSRGLEPRSLKEEKTWVAAMLQGGSLGVMGDFLFGSESRYGHSAMEEVLGPTWAMTSDLWNITSNAVRGKDVSTQAIYALKNHMTPTTFYTRGVTDYMITYQLLEAMNPGYLRNMERRKKKEQNQEYLIRPSGVF